MAYATIDDVLAVYEQAMIDRLCYSKLLAGPDYTKLTTALNNASYEIDSYVSTKYAVPVDPIPNIIKQVNIDLGIYYLSLTQDKLTTEMSTRAAYWRSWLAMVSRSQVGLGILNTQVTSDGDEPTEGTGVGTAVTGQSVRGY